ncbi:c-type cytochrome [Thiohalophilus sp.]|uniref:c-type cytochrome n=1 Tax=Thiohalophilus sp. TaxID=3028392 RepID=UPI003974FD32
MSDHITPSTRLSILCSIGIMFSTPAVSAAEGKHLFQQHCSRCHQTPAKLTTPPDQLPELLRSDTIRPHRFELDDEALRHIVAYINQERS